MTDLDPPVGEPVGFPGCGSCPYQINGPVRVCTWCASRTLEPLAPDRCAVCSQALDPNTHTCRNRLCRDPRRRIISIDALAVYSGELRAKIIAYKYNGQTGWARIFGRLVLGYLQVHWPPEDLDLILPNPTYCGPGARSDFPHAEVVIDCARREDVLEQYTFAPFTPAVLEKTGPTPQSAGGTAAAKEKAAAELYPLLRLPDPEAVRGRRVMIYDDICTTGGQLNTVARYLLDEGGAAAVYGLVLARVPWT